MTIFPRRRDRRRFCASAFLLGAVVAAVFPAAQVFTREARAEANAPAAALEQLVIVTASGRHPFLVEVMRTEEQRERGLMFRRSLPADRGMLFDFEAERPVAMWMKNTFIPLDMVFIARNGRVVGLAENTEPLSEAIIRSGPSCSAVLELNAGAAARIGLKVGDLVAHPLFAK